MPVNPNSSRLRLAKRLSGLAKQLEGVRVRPDLDQLAARHGVSIRTIRRDLEALTAGGWIALKGFNPENW